MRYLTLKSNGKWQFRYQIPERYRRHFSNRYEIKKTLHVTSKQEAYLAGIEHELALKKYMSEITIGDVTSSFDESYARSAIAKVAKTGIEQIYLVMSRVREDKTFKAALKQARFTQDAIGGADAIEGLFTLDLSFSGALQCLFNVYPDQVSARDRAKIFVQECMHFDVSARNSSSFDVLFNKLIMVFQHLINARKAIELMKFDEVKLISVQLAKLSEFEGKLLTVEEFKKTASHEYTNNLSNNAATRQAANTKATTPQPTKSSDVIEGVDIEKILEAYEKEKKFELRLKHNPQSLVEEKKVYKDINTKIERVRSVHKIIGQPDVTKISRSDCSVALQELFCFPADPCSSGNKHHFIDRPKEEWIEINNHVGHPVIKQRSALKYISQSSEVYKWAVTNKMVEDNPFYSVAGSKHIKEVDEKDKKVPFSQHDLKGIFSHPVFVNLELGVNPMTKAQLNYQYWAPLLSYLSGMRPNEVCQLKVGNILRHEDILCFQINGEGEKKSTKSKNSNRFVPIHSKLIDLGLLRLTEGRQADELLFKDLTYTASSQYYGKLEGWVNRTFILPMSLSKKKKTYYSFRHTFIDFYIQNSKEGYILSQLIGHEPATLAEQVYGGRANINKLKEMIEMFDYGDVLDGVLPFFTKETRE
ncbi:site-specific integrase [Vibrio lentus]|uniref:site-specific integrase n=1 Tax=Vibrio lentus TaxID=136468 RepID=UPI000C8460B3|nr:site-specific integrase [Vibrio lentus]PMG64490.1 hypothetical protein BCU86_18300 [Vibrio lentus]